MALSNARFFAGLVERALILDLKQVRRYLQDPWVRQMAIKRVAEAVSEETRVLVGHSLGSVVAYEALCAHPDWPVQTLLTLGSPLGIRHLIFDRLQPPPVTGPDGKLQGHWPGRTTGWVNIADARDVVALVKDLRVAFGQRVQGWLIDNGAHAHNISPYLTAVETGRAIAKALS
jgi:pimeloyl-ACP methyl ester carboxylesterase